MTHASVFSGIGGPEVAATMLGWENLFHCEINPFGRAVLDYWYPNAKSYDDITKTDFTEWRGRVDVLTGGFPCQPFSYAGQRRGAEDDRYLWPYMFKCIDTIRPTWVVAENVGGILTMVEQGEVSGVETQGALFGEEDVVRRYELRETFTLERICRDLETHGYAVQPVLVPACAVGAPHRRDRVFIVGRRRDDIVADPDNGADGRAAGADEGEGGAQRLQERHEVRKPDEPNQVRREGAEIVADTDGGRREKSEQPGWETHQEETGARLDDTTERPGTNDAAAHAVGGGEGTSGEGGGVEGDGSDQDKQPCQRRAATEWNSRFYELLRNAAGGTADTNGERLEMAASKRVQGHEGRGERIGVCLGAGDCRQGFPDGRWQSFPSVSPVHRGNDGLPFPLDDLTLSPAKWRTEALKAYGNAIVPQVMYEIFRAIEIAEKRNT